MTVVLFLISFTILIGIFLFRLLIRNIRGELIYKDDGKSQLLVSDTLQIDGKPDYIYRQWFGHLMPVELKKKKSFQNNPYLGDVMQIAAYFVLIEENFHKKPKYGILQYENKKFYIRNTKKLKRKLERILQQMILLQETERLKGFKKNLDKCRTCGHKKICKV
ncbi:Dna2/Cas4 domain-containing protein [Margalitia sp. FSL K6-0131]|uniref:CRISPR-associated protein Cas4 n=1 Tax=Margalitia sp. FSL K6-0131 TaxID=2954604 RepID=UPI0030FC9541